MFLRNLEKIGNFENNFLNHDLVQQKSQLPIILCIHWFTKNNKKKKCLSMFPLT